MIELEPEIRKEFERIQSEFGDGDEKYGTEYLSSEDVLRAHFLIANHFYLLGEGIGGIGPRDLNLLRSAISRQTIAFGGKTKWTDRFEICATLFFGLIKNHPFHDANKRTAFLSVLYLLHRYGYCPSVSEKEFEDFTVEIADDLLDKYARYLDLKRSDPDPEVKFIAWYLRRHMRKIDKAHYVVTFRELQTILNRYGFALADPSGNRIDIIRRQRRPALFGLLGHREEIVRLGQVGFPRWTAQVQKSAIKTVREVTGLTAEKGVDSAAFFQGLDPMQSLITTYHAPLMNLAHR